jgi:hypothetical protein
MPHAGEFAAITRQYGCGLLAPPGDADAMAERIRALYRDRPLASEAMSILGVNAHHVDLSAVLLRDGEPLATVKVAQFRPMVGAAYNFYPKCFVRRFACRPIIS